MDLESEDLVADRVERLKELFPEVATEGDGSIDFEKLRLILGDEVDEGDERYAFTWPGKADAIRQAQTTSTATLRPCPEKSVNWGTTRNLYIEGDNLEVLKLLQRSYHGKVKMIYIDPPYNTGHDFVYHDSFGDSIRNYKEQTGLSGQSNADTSGRYHSNWCSMMYPRLKLARELLSDDGVMFVSIGEIEYANLRNICLEIFGENNILAQLVWEKKKKGAFLSKHYISMKEYILVVLKNINFFHGLIGEINHNAETYPCIKTTNARGIRTIPAGTPVNCRKRTFSIVPNTRISSGNMELIYLDKAEVRDGVLLNDVSVESNWIYGQDKIDLFASAGELYLTQDLYVRRRVNEDRVKMLKDLLLRVGADGQSQPRYTYDENLNNGGWGTNEDANDELHNLLGVQNVFDFCKPTKLLAKLIQSIADDNAIILDFFSGSGSIADAVMQLNAADGGNRKFILVQLPELCGDGTAAANIGYKTICEIGEERIRCAGRKLIEETEQSNHQFEFREEPKETPDIGFRVFKLDDSGIERPKPGQLVIDCVKAGRSDEDIIFEVMLKWGLELTYPIERIEVRGYPCYSVAEDALICCMQEGLTVEVIQAIADRLPNRVFMLDSILNDTLKLNAVQIFKHVEEKNQVTIDLRTV